MERFDAAVIGGGLLGCFTARELARFDLRVLLIEAAEDVCTGISKSNTAIVYTGFDSRPGSLKAALTARANAAFGELCAELGVTFSRCGSLMTACGPAAAAVLEKKLRNAEKSRIPGVSLISGAEARELEPALSERVQSALYAENTGTVSPWSLCFAAFENARANGFTNNIKHERGVLSMARSMMPNSAGSQFFVMHENAPHLDGSYAAFGRVTEGMETVDEIAETKTDRNDRPVTPQKIKRVTVEDFGASYPFTKL